MGVRPSKQKVLRSPQKYVLKVDAEEGAAEAVFEQAKEGAAAGRSSVMINLIIRVHVRVRVRIYQLYLPLVHVLGIQDMDC